MTAPSSNGKTADLCEVPCLICTRNLRSFDDRTNHPLGGLEFTTPGHYGSAVFDPMDGTRLAINICDWCLVTYGKEGALLNYKRGKSGRNGFSKPRRWKVPRHVAQAIEARRVETAKQGSIGDESAVA